MEACKGEKLSVYPQPSFMIDNLLTRKSIDQNGDFSTMPAAPLGDPRMVEHRGDTINGSGRTAMPDEVTLRTHEITGGFYSMMHCVSL